MVSGKQPDDDNHQNWSSHDDSTTPIYNHIKYKQYICNSAWSIYICKTEMQIILSWQRSHLAHWKAVVYNDTLLKCKTMANNLGNLLGFFYPKMPWSDDKQMAKTSRVNRINSHWRPDLDSTGHKKLFTWPFWWIWIMIWDGFCNV